LRTLSGAIRGFRVFSLSGFESAVPTLPPSLAPGDPDGLLVAGISPALLVAFGCLLVGAGLSALLIKPPPFKTSPLKARLLKASPITAWPIRVLRSRPKPRHGIARRPV
jgi:hypothetical protein